MIAILLLATGLRFFRLGDPKEVIFDETYYAKDACLYTGLDAEACALPKASEQSWVHPPLGKWLIAGGIKIFGFNSFGWRVASATFGTALVLVLYLLARRLYKVPWIAGAAGLFAAADFLLIVQSRVAMLDIFLAFFVVLGFLFLAFDRERILLLKEHARLPFPGEPPRREPEWRVLAGAAFGMAIATKWSGVWALAAALLLTVAWSIRLTSLARRREEVWFWGTDRLGVRELILTIFALVIVPAFVYLLSYVHWLSQNGFSLVELTRLHSRMFAFHANLEATHGYQSPAMSWPLTLRPVAYYYEQKGGIHHILAFGNPLTWWASIAAVAWMGIDSIRRWSPHRLVLAAILVQLGAWVVISDKWLSDHFKDVVLGAYLLIAVPLVILVFVRSFRNMRSWPASRKVLFMLATFVALVVVPALFYFVPPSFAASRAAIFIFYMTPIVPFMILGLAAALGAIRDAVEPQGFGRIIRALPVAFLVLTVISVLWFYPVIAGLGLERAAWLRRMLFEGPGLANWI